MNTRLPLLARVLAVLAAACLVAAFAIALLAPPDMPLQYLVADIDHRFPVNFQGWVRGHLGDWAWSGVFAPVLARPAWLVPLSFSLVFAGLALTTLNGRRVPGSPRWRN